MIPKIKNSNNKEMLRQQMSAKSKERVLQSYPGAPPIILVIALNSIIIAYGSYGMPFLCFSWEEKSHELP
jgi:hypothetical protein